MTDKDRFARLSERQRIYLRHVFQHQTSKEIARLLGVSSRAVDKQLGLACETIGTDNRFDAARLFAEYEAGVEGFYPASVAPSHRPFWPLPLPLPSKARPINMLTRQQILAWAVVIAISTPAGITVGAMLIISIALLLGRHF